MMEPIVADKIYTAADYEELPEGAPYQLIDANLIYRPSPTSTHQEIAGWYRLLPISSLCKLRV